MTDSNKSSGQVQVWWLASNQSCEKLNKKDKEDRQTEIGKYRVEHNVMTIGWGLCESKYKPDRDKVVQASKAGWGKCWQEYENHANSLFKNKWDSVKRFHGEVKKDDLIWMRINGAYYIGRVGNNSHWEYHADAEALKIDSLNQRTDVEWHEVGIEDTVAGRIAIAGAGRNRSLFRIGGEKGDEFVRYYSQKVFNELSSKDIYSLNEISLNRDSFYRALGPSLVEDLLGMWLYRNGGYICIPSTNKSGTPRIEYVLQNPETGERAFIQVKNKIDGTNKEFDLDADEYEDYAKEGEVYLLTTGKHHVKNADKHEHIHEVNQDELFTFATDVENKDGKKVLKNETILSRAIAKWIRYLDPSITLQFQ